VLRSMISRLIATIGNRPSRTNAFVVAEQLCGSGQLNDGQ
jgi:hypothetical protein